MDVEHWSYLPWWWWWLCHVDLRRPPTWSGSTPGRSSCKRWVWIQDFDFTIYFSLRITLPLRHQTIGPLRQTKKRCWIRLRWGCILFFWNKFWFTLQPIENDQTRDVVAFANPQMQEVRINYQYFGEREKFASPFQKSENKYDGFAGGRRDRGGRQGARERPGHGGGGGNWGEFLVKFLSLMFKLRSELEANLIKIPFPGLRLPGKNRKVSFLRKATNICEILEQNTPNAVKSASPAF